MSNYFFLLFFVVIRGSSCSETNASEVENVTVVPEHISSSIPKTKRFSVISEYSIAEPLYIMVRSKKLNPPTRTGLDDKITMQICKDIFGNDFFATMGYRVQDISDYDVDPSKTVKEEAKEDLSPTTLSDVIIANQVKEEAKEDLSPTTEVQGEPKDIHSIQEMPKSLDNGKPTEMVEVLEMTDSTSKKMNVFLYEREKPFEEHGFVCLPYKDDIVEFFVSEEYNVASRPDSYIAGHFIFQPIYNPHLYVLAEEAAQAESLDNVELHYLQLRETNAPTITMANDPLCKLDFFEQNRICLSVLSASRYNPREDSIHRRELNMYCQGRTISFRTVEGREKALAGAVLFQTEEESDKALAGESIEWTLGCEYRGAELILSQAYENDRVFVYLLDNDQKLYVDALMSRVRFECH